MYKETYLDQVKKAIEGGYKETSSVEIFDQLPKIGLALRTPCYMAFFTLVNSNESLWNTFQDTQREILRMRSEKGEDWPRDINLILLLSKEISVSSSVAREILDDRYFCRKFIIRVNGEDVAELLGNLPFWPAYDLVEAPGTTVSDGIQRTIKGYDPRLIADFANYSPGSQRIFEKLLEDAYSPLIDYSEEEASIRPRLVQSSQTKLQAIDITDFRGIRRLTPQNISFAGDIVFVYGPNGVGKTSIVDAIEWAITGQVNRLEHFSRTFQSKVDPFVNVFSTDRRAQVICEFSNRESIRRNTHERSSLRFIGSHKVSDDRAIIDHVVGTRAPSQEARLGIQQLRDLFRSSHMLSQHDLRTFLEDTKATDRFDILTRMIGAEQFVRFREKVSTVLRRIHSEIVTASETSKSQKHNLDDISARLSERKKEIDTLSHAVTDGIEPEQFLSDFLDNLRHYECLNDEQIVKQSKDQPIEYRIDSIFVNADSWIRTKKADINQTLITVESLKQGLPTYLDALESRKRLQTEIKEAIAQSETSHEELLRREQFQKNRQSILNDLKATQSAITKRLNDIIWLQQGLARYCAHRESVDNIQNSYRVRREESERLGSVLQEKHGLLNAKRARQREVNELIATKENRYQGLISLKRQLADVQNLQREISQMRAEEDKCNFRLRNLRLQESSVARELSVLQGNIDKLEQAYETEASRHELLSSLLVTLSQTLKMPECPLCGRTFQNINEALQTIQAHSSTFPISLKETARELEGERDRAEKTRKQILTVKEAIVAMETTVRIIQSKQFEATNRVQAFIAECGSKGLKLAADINTWQKIMEDAFNECQVADLHTERNASTQAIESLVLTISELQKKVDNVRQKIDQDDRLIVQINTKLRMFENEMLQRGFDTTILRDNKSLAPEIEQIQSEIKTINSRISVSNAEAQNIESGLIDFRASLRKIKEDIASKTNQLNDFENIVAHFVASCQNAGLNHNEPITSFESTRVKASRMLESLSTLDISRQNLGRVATLLRLRREINNLELDQEQADEQYQNSVDRETGLRKWESLIKSLEAEVVRRQVDAVSSHLVELEPTSQRLYHRLNPHPVFGGIRVRVNDKSREFDIEAQMRLIGNDCDNLTVSPSVFFSEAQMNGLAITVFLAGALRQRWSFLNTILIDDPVQQMDDMNVSAFLDLLRGLSHWRQFVIFTCSRDFYLLALEKLESMNKCRKKSFLGYRLEGIAPSKLKVTCDVG